MNYFPLVSTEDLFYTSTIISSTEVAIGVCSIVIVYSYSNNCI